MSQSKRKKPLLDKFLMFLNWLCAIGLLFSYLAWYIDPRTLSIFAFAGLSYPVLLLCNLVFILYWLLRFNRRLLLSLICILLGFPQLIRTYQFGNTYSASDPDKRLKVMSYNVRMFNAYEWITTEDIPGGIENLLQTYKPDVLLIQEYHKVDMQPNLGFEHDFKLYTNDGENYGLTIYSNFPILNTGSYPYFQTSYPGEIMSNNEFIFADILWDGDTIRFINAHLASVGLLQNDYQRLKNPNEGSNEEIQEGFITIVRRLHSAFQKRSGQLDAVEKAIDKSPHPVILCGDFNDTPYSYTYHQINKKLEDAFLNGGEGISKTYSRGPMPFRIDHIFHSEELKAIEHRVIYRKLSDHYPVTTEFEWVK